MKRKLNTVQRSKEQDIQGICATSYMTLMDFQNAVDPLAQNATNANKPASSIPSMFARLMFFRTAYANVLTTPTLTNSVYAKFVSDSLDLLEALFDHSDNFTIEQWNKDEQLLKLNNNIVLHNALEIQAGRFLPGVTDIYLFVEKDSGLVVGGTSPFSIVYTSPNWINIKPTQMLVTRTPRFREFMYRFAVAHASDSQLREFVGFINSSKEFDPQFRTIDFGGLWTKDQLLKSYPSYSITENVPVVIDPTTQLYLYSRDASVFDSDFFINSKLQKFNQANTPLFLTQGVQPGMAYYDTVKNVNLSFVEVEMPDADCTPRQLPGCNFQHTYLSSIDFMEDVLLKVPYKINSDRWGNIIHINNGTESCFLPLKPMLFKYFKTSDIANLLTCKVDDIRKEVIVTLNVPVRSADGARTKDLSVTKTYAYKDIQCFPGMQPAYTIGVAPFYKSGKHYVIRQDQATVATSEIEFYSIGGNKAITVQGVLRSDDALSRSTYYEVNTDFDYIRVEWPAGHGILIPNYRDIGAGGSKYYYGLDFGTTNTHVAYTKDGDTVATSFNTDEFKLQVEYLSSEGKTGDDVLLTTAAREFLPSNHRDDYSFPIRTVTSEVGQLNVNSKIFSEVSIGFRYSKEFTRNPIYNKDLKWDFNRAVLNANVNKRVNVFCEELLWIIKNHWMLQEDANHQVTPEIWLTYPLVMGNWHQLLNVWKNAYAIVFNVNPDEALTKIHSITESLAPCRNTMAGGGATTAGILNIDMGGGSTDFQYYCDAESTEKENAESEKENIKSIYNSILFAGDDLWGKGYENTGSAIGTAISRNAFTDFASSSLKNASIIVGGVPTTYEQLIFQDPKDKINCLLKDTEHNFTNALSNPVNNTCRKIMYLHYAAIMWHVSKWMVVNGVKSIPLNISFTGLASKYLDLLFDTDVRFKAFTTNLLTMFSGLPVDENLTITKVASPKNITAEGAALYALDNANNEPIPVSRLSYHLGYESYVDEEQLTFNDVASKKQEVLDSLKHFLKDFNSIGDCNHILTPQQVIELTDNEINNLITDASVSFDEMVKINKRPGQITDSLFFWALKGSLWKLHK